jgi:hypothetical protein
MAALQCWGAFASRKLISHPNFASEEIAANADVAAHTQLGGYPRYPHLSYGEPYAQQQQGQPYGASQYPSPYAAAYAQQPQPQQPQQPQPQIQQQQRRQTSSRRSSGSRSGQGEGGGPPARFSPPDGRQAPPLQPWVDDVSCEQPQRGNGGHGSGV